MHPILRPSRREFLKCAAAAGLAVAGRACAQDALPPREALATVAPEAVGVDPALLQKAVDFVSEAVAAKTVPGAALVATRGGRVFLEKYWGVCSGVDRDGVPYDGNTQNFVYSFSKAVTATVMVMAHQDGLVDYDAPVSRYIPEFTGGGKEAVTVRHVLTHAAGLPSAELKPVLSEDEWKAAVAALCAMDTEWEPGSRTGYHAISGMLLAAEVVRRVSGNRPWNDLCRERLFDPLGADIAFAPPGADASLAVVPPPASHPWPVDTAHMAFLGHPSGGAIARPSGMLKLLNLHLAGGVWNGKQLLQPAALAEMHRVQYQAEIDAALRDGKTPKHEYWGLGWLLRGAAEESWFGFGNVASPRTFGHAGIDTVIGVADPDRDTALVFITTGSPGEPATTTRLRNTVTNRVMAAVPA